MSNGLNLLHPRKDVAEMVIVFCVSLIVPEDVMIAIKSGEHVYQESSFFVSPLSFLRVSWWYQVSMSWCNCSKMSEVLAGAHIGLMVVVHDHTMCRDFQKTVNSSCPYCFLMRHSNFPCKSWENHNPKAWLVQDFFHQEDNYCWCHYHIVHLVKIWA